MAEERTPDEQRTLGTLKGFYTLLIAGAATVALLGRGGCLGTRGTINDLAVEVKGTPAQVVHDDVRWGPDVYRLQGNGFDVYAGTVPIDGGYFVTVHPSGVFSNGGYDITDRNPQH